MARKRYLKPSFFMNEKVAELKPLDRILYQGLWCQADKEGRLEDRIKRLKIQILPYDNHDIDAGLNRLYEKGLITRYEAKGRKFIQIHKWKEHQTPHSKETESEIPEIPDGYEQETEKPVQGPEIPVPVTKKKVQAPERSAGLPPLDLDLDLDSNLDLGSDSEKKGGEGLTPLARLWNDIVQSPKVQKITKSRKEKEKSRLEEHSDMAWWRCVFERIVSTPFLRGEGPQGWRADYDWIIVNDKNCVKVFEGGYDGNRKPRPNGPSTERRKLESSLAALRAFGEEASEQEGAPARLNAPSDEPPESRASPGKNCGMGMDSQGPNGGGIHPWPSEIPKKPRRDLSENKHTISDQEIRPSG